MPDDDAGMDAARAGMESVGYHYARRSQWPDAWQATVAEAASAFDAAILGEKQKLLEDVVDEIFDMVKPKERNAITLKDLVDCKVGETVVGILTDVFAFLQYDQREQLMHSAEE